MDLFRTVISVLKIKHCLHINNQKNGLDPVSFKMILCISWVAFFVTLQRELLETHMNQIANDQLHGNNCQLK